MWGFFRLLLTMVFGYWFFTRTEVGREFTRQLEIEQKSRYRKKKGNGGNGS